MTDPPSHDRSGAALWGVVTIVFVLAAVLAGTRFTRVAGDQLADRFDLAYETPALASVQLLQDGINPYAAAVYDEVPFVITMYTPIYPLLVALLPGDADNPYRAGRLVSLVAMVCAAAGLALVGRAAPVPALAALATFVLLWPVTQKAAFVRGDGLALALSVMAVLLLRGPRVGSGRIVAAALFAVGAVATKQTSAAALAACWLHLCLRPLGGARLFAAVALVAGALLALGAHAAWGTGFWFCTLVVPTNPFSATHFANAWREMLRQPAFALVLSALVAWVVTRGAGTTSVTRQVAGEPHGFRVRCGRSPLVPYVLCTWVILLATLGKRGSWTNYFIEPSLAVLLWAVDALSLRWAGWRGPVQGRDRGPARRAACAALLVALPLGLELWLAAPADYAHSDSARRAERAAFADGLRTVCTELGLLDPSVLDVYTPVHDLMLGSRVHFNDPLLYSLSWKSGTLSPRPLLDAVGDGRFDLVLLPRGMSLSSRPEGPVGDVILAVLSRYRRARSAGPADLYLP